jgi:hypothetical protein
MNARRPAAATTVKEVSAMSALMQLDVVTITSTDDWKELASREGDGLAVSLLWSASADRVKITVADVRLDEEFELDVAGANALAAFHHPFAFAAGRGVSFGDGLCESLDLQPQD